MRILCDVAANEMASGTCDVFATHVPLASLAFVLHRPLATRRSRYLISLPTTCAFACMLRWRLLLFLHECGREPCRLVTIIWSQLAINHEAEEIVLEWPQPWPRLAPKDLHQVVAVQRAADRHALGLLT